MSTRYLVGAVVVLSLTLAVEVSGQVIPRRVTQSVLHGRMWLKSGGTRTPLGEVSSTTFSKIGLKLEMSGNGYRTIPMDSQTSQYATFTVDCSDSKLKVILFGYRTRPDGSARFSIAERFRVSSPSSIHEVGWVSGYIGQPVSIADLSHLRGQLIDHSFLTLATATMDGFHYWRFDLDGLEVQESLCP